MPIDVIMIALESPLRSGVTIWTSEMPAIHINAPVNPCHNASSLMTTGSGETSSSRGTRNLPSSAKLQTSFSPYRFANSPASTGPTIHGVTWYLTRFDQMSAGYDPPAASAAVLSAPKYSGREYSRIDA